jgi:multidrug efflux pump
MEDLRNAIAGANVSGPKGSLDGAQQAYTIALNDQIAAADAYKPIIIAYRNGAPITIGDVAIIVDGRRTIVPVAGIRARRPSSSTSSGSPAPT